MDPKKVFAAFLLMFLLIAAQPKRASADEVNSVPNTVSTLVENNYLDIFFNGSLIYILEGIQLIQEFPEG